MLERCEFRELNEDLQRECGGFSCKDEDITEFFYRAQNETYKEVGCEKRRKALPVKELCVMAASGRAKRNVYIGLHSV